MKFSIDIKIRFADTDMLGHVNNSSYFTYIEEARIEFLRQVLGLDSVPLIIASAKVNFRAQAYFGQTLEVESWISRVGNSSFDVTSQIREKETGQTVFDAVAVLVHFDYASQASQPLPQVFLEKMQPYIELANEELYR
ncbi:acyl-CoA thioesterase [Alicyclobacillus tolerans]|uniref:acyl-CoA thioesterase n=1 Tax=Alicyclobacillus tolerans TaxID=90970 RepID=UPI001F2B287B|nr:thioesterase family protein [Alicyclobacillus tolerans]MCF8565351.1 acyl-CoA thioesterase [Alicyclobacillus tolerans]